MSNPSTLASTSSSTPPQQASISNLRTTKPNGHELYHNILKSPKFIVAPMVEGSELAWRILSRYYGAQLCYTPMIHSTLFSDPKNLKYRSEQFDLKSNEEGSHDLDRPLIAQFCSNDPQTFLNASNLLVDDDLDKVDAIDLNLGCPQGIARKGKYGAFLMDHLDLIEKMGQSHSYSSIHFYKLKSDSTVLFHKFAVLITTIHTDEKLLLLHTFNNSLPHAPTL